MQLRFLQLRFLQLLILRLACRKSRPLSFGTGAFLFCYFILFWIFPPAKILTPAHSSLFFITHDEYHAV